MQYNLIGNGCVLVVQSFVYLVSFPTVDVRMRPKPPVREFVVRYDGTRMCPKENGSLDGFGGTNFMSDVAGRGESGPKKSLVRW